MKLLFLIPFILQLSLALAQTEYLYKRNNGNYMIENRVLTQNDSIIVIGDYQWSKENGKDISVNYISYDTGKTFKLLPKSHYLYGSMLTDRYYTNNYLYDENKNLFYKHNIANNKIYYDSVIKLEFNLLKDFHFLEYGYMRVFEDDGYLYLFMDFSQDVYRAKVNETLKFYMNLDQTPDDNWIEQVIDFRMVNSKYGFIYTTKFDGYWGRYTGRLDKPKDDLTMKYWKRDNLMKKNFIITYDFINVLYITIDSGKTWNQLELDGILAKRCPGHGFNRLIVNNDSLYFYHTYNRFKFRNGYYNFFYKILNLEYMLLDSMIGITNIKPEENTITINTELSKYNIKSIDYNMRSNRKAIELH